MVRRAADQSTDDSADGFAGEVGSSSQPRPDHEPEPLVASADTGPHAAANDGPGDAARPPTGARVDAGPQFLSVPDATTPHPTGPPSPPIRARLRPPDRPPGEGRRREPRGPRVVQGRRSRRVVRRIDSWTVFKLSFLFYLCGGLILLIAGVALWNIASAFDVITNVQKFVQKLFDLQTFKIQAKVILAYSAVGAGVLVLLGTGANVLMALLYNLISDVIGGVQVIVLEETDIDAPSVEPGRGRGRGGNQDRATGRRDRPAADDRSLSP